MNGAFIHVYIQSYIHAYINTVIHTYICTSLKHVSLHTYINKYMHTLYNVRTVKLMNNTIHTYIHTYIHTCIHTHVSNQYPIRSPLIIKVYISYIHTYLPGATFYYSPEVKWESLLKQRRRWLNGTFAAPGPPIEWVSEWVSGGMYARRIQEHQEQATGQTSSTESSSCSWWLTLFSSVIFGTTSFVSLKQYIGTNSPQVVWLGARAFCFKWAQIRCASAMYGWRSSCCSTHTGCATPTVRGRFRRECPSSTRC